MLRVIILTTIFLINTAISSTCDSPTIDVFQDEDLSAVLADCAEIDDRVKNADRDIAEYCKCATKKNFSNDIRKDHAKFVAKEFQKSMTKAMYSISNDLNILDGK